MTINRQDSFNKTDITDCGKQGIPPPPPNQAAYSADELRKYILQHTFTIEVTGPETAGIWLTWLNNLGDKSAAHLRRIEITMPGIEVSLIIDPSQRTTSCVDYRIQFLRDLRVGGEAVHADAADALREAVSISLKKSIKQIRSTRMIVYGPGDFSRKEINRLGKVVFRLPAACHEEMAKLEQVNKQEEEADTNEESAVESSEDEQNDDQADTPANGSSLKGKGQQKEDRGRQIRREKAELIEHELTLREHARNCETCSCKWIENLEGISSFYYHPFVKKQGQVSMICSGRSLEPDCGDDCALTKKLSHTDP